MDTVDGPGPVGNTPEDEGASVPAGAVKLAPDELVPVMSLIVARLRAAVSGAPWPDDDEDCDEEEGEAEVVLDRLHRGDSVGMEIHFCAYSDSVVIEADFDDGRSMTWVYEWGEDQAADDAEVSKIFAHAVEYVEAMAESAKREQGR